MKIFYAAGASPNAYQISESNLWKNNLFDSLVQMGHEVVPFSRDVTWHFSEYLNYMSDPVARAKFMDYRSRLQTELLEEIKAEHGRGRIDIFFSYFWSEICDPATVEAIKALGITTVNWFCNASYQFDLVAGLAPAYDFSLVPERFRLDDYRAAGARPIYCQEAANQQIYKPYDVPCEFDVTFVGQSYGDRPAHINYLRSQGIDVRVWGPGWPLAPTPPAAPTPPVLAHRRAAHIGRRLLRPDGWQAALRRLPRLLNRAANASGSNPASASAEVAAPDAPSDEALPIVYGGGVLSDMEMVKMYSRSKINLGFSTCGETHLAGERIMQIRLRDFEVPMSGGFYMVEYMEELEEFYRVGEEIVCYTNMGDLADKIKYYLSHESEREAIRRAGYERCLRDHTWQKRFEAAFKEMKLTSCAALPVS